MPDWVLMGRVAGLYGVLGWVKVISHTQPRDSLADYAPLYLNRGGRWQPIAVEEKRLQGKGLILKFAGYEDRDAAAALIGCDIAVRREQLPLAAPGEYYWADLEGLRVITLDGMALGKVQRLFETGANDVVVVTGERERLIPFLQGDVIVKIDLEGGEMWVDWDPAF